MKISKISVIAVIIIMLASCSTDYLEETPPNIFSSETLAQDYEGFDALVNGLYEIARHCRWQSEKIENAINGVDNFTSNRGRSDIFELWQSSNSPDDSDLEEIWAWLYEIIQNANNIIDLAENPDVDWAGGPLSPALENKYMVLADARAVRAWAYRRLAWSWGDVPLSLHFPKSIVTDWERAPRAQVRAQMITDFKWAQQYVPTEASLRGRMTKGAVQTFLAETYLAIGKPDSAKYWCDQAINNPAYYLVTERYGLAADDPEASGFSSMWRHTWQDGGKGNYDREDGNTEALWVWQFRLRDALDERGHEMSRAITGEYNLYHPANTPLAKLSLQFTYARGGRGKNYFTPTRWWSTTYEEFDDRAQNDILRKFFILKTAEENFPGGGADKLPNDTVNYPEYKWEYGDTIWLDNSPANEITPDHNHVPNIPYSRKGEGTDPNDMGADFAWTNQIYLRLADTYLLRAEANFKMGNIDAAVLDINAIRERSHATPITAGEVTMDFILDERSRELITEEDRRYTLLRIHNDQGIPVWYERTKAHNFNGGQLIELRDTLFPIPQTVIDANLTKEFPQNAPW